MDKECYKNTFSEDDLKILLKKYREEEEQAWQSYVAIRDKAQMLEEIIEEDCS